MRNQEKIVMYESDAAATFKEGLSGWVSNDGRFWGKDEHIARYAGCTHKLCECGNVMTKHYTKCEVCRSRLADERYNALEHKDWSGEPLVLYQTDTYFFDEGEVYDYLTDNPDTEAQFMICDPIIAPYIEEYGIDQLPDDMTIDDVDPKLAAMIAEINKYVQENRPILSWFQGKYRTTVTLPNNPPRTPESE